MRYNCTTNFKLAVLVLLFSRLLPVLAITDTLLIDEVVVFEKRSPEIYSALSRIIYTIDGKTISNMPVATIQDILEYTASVDIRQRGSEGVQADISTRGGSFEQVLILLNGVRFNDPQTGHHSLNLPISVNDIERIEILSGPGARIFGPNAFSGAINIVTKNPEVTSVNGQLRAGQFGYKDISISGSFSTGEFNNYLSVSRKSSDGFTENTDFNQSNYFFRTKTTLGNGGIDFQAGLLNKQFGASNFYSSLYPEQFEKISSSFTNLTYRTGNRVIFSQTVYFRRHRDRFELFRYESPSWYNGHNYHLSDIYGTTASVSIPYSIGNLYFSGEIRREQIFSSVLGEPLAEPKRVRYEENVYFTKFKKRDQINISAGNRIIVGNTSLSGGVLLTGTFPGELAFMGGADISYNVNNFFTLFSSLNQAARIPTFTEMYYSGPVNSGNPNLKHEKSVTAESGIKFRRNRLGVTLVAFNRNGTNIIDWVREPGELVWESKNMTVINSFGVEFDLMWRPGSTGKYRIEELRGGYNYNNIYKKSNDYLSAYILDNLKHKVTASLLLKAGEKNDIGFAAVYSDRAGSYTDFSTGNELSYTPVAVFDIRIRRRLSGYINATIDISNIFNNEYFDIGNVPLPGRWIKGGIEIKFQP